MKIISWNVNGYRSVYNKGILAALLDSESPDIFCMQEVKCAEDKVPWVPEEYECYFHPGTYTGRHGTAVFVKSSSVADSYTVSQDNWVLDSGEEEGRLQVVVFKDWVLCNTYTVNSREGLSRLSVRLKYDSMVREHICSCMGKYKVILTGDLNVCASNLDFHRGILDPSTPCQSDEERHSFRQYLDLGLVDIYREFTKTGRDYTYWSNFSQSRSKNLGWRLDYFLVDERMKASVTEYKVLSHIYGSDHAPIKLEINV
jgi:exodeoxyribonuclease-3